MQLSFTATALKDLKKLNKITQKQIVKKLQFFLEQPNPLAYATKFTNFSRGGDYRFRIGDYRAVFDVEADTIHILYIEHRREVYRRN